MYEKSGDMPRFADKSKNLIKLERKTRKCYFRRGDLVTILLPYFSVTVY